MGIYLRSPHKPTGPEDRLPFLDSCERVQCNTLATISSLGECGPTTTTLVRASGPKKASSVIYPDHIIQPRKGPEPEVGWTVYRTIGSATYVASHLKLDTSYFDHRRARAVFQISKAQWQLAAVVVFSRPDASKVAFLIGSAKDVGGVSVQCISGHYYWRFEEWEHEYAQDPRKTTNSYNLGRELAVVRIDSVVKYNRKYYLVDFEVTQNPDLVDEVEGSVPQ